MEVGIEVVVTRGLEHALREFQKKVSKAGLLAEIKRHSRFLSRAELRRRKRAKHRAKVRYGRADEPDATVVSRMSPVGAAGVRVADAPDAEASEAG